MLTITSVDTQNLVVVPHHILFFSKLNFISLGRKGIRSGACPDQERANRCRKLGFTRNMGWNDHSAIFSTLPCFVHLLVAL